MVSKMILLKVALALLCCVRTQASADKDLLVVREDDIPYLSTLVELNDVKEKYKNAERALLEAEKRLDSGITGAVVEKITAAAASAASTLEGGKKAAGEVASDSIKKAKDTAEHVKSSVRDAVKHVFDRACTFKESAKRYLVDTREECYDSSLFKVAAGIADFLQELVLHTPSFGPADSSVVVSLVGNMFFNGIRALAIGEAVVLVFIYGSFKIPLAGLALTYLFPVFMHLTYTGYTLYRIKLWKNRFMRAQRIVKNVFLTDDVGEITREAHVEGSTIHEVNPVRYVAEVHRAGSGDTFVGLIWRHGDYLITCAHVLAARGVMIKSRQGTLVRLPLKGWKISAKNDVAVVQCTQALLSQSGLGSAKSVKLPRLLMNTKVVEVGKAACGAILTRSEHAPYALLHSCSTTGGGSSGAPLVNDSGDVVAMHVGAMKESGVNTCVYLSPLFRAWRLKGFVPESYGEETENELSLESEEDRRESKADKVAAEEERQYQVAQTYYRRRNSEVSSDSRDDRERPDVDDRTEDLFANGQFQYDEGTRNFEIVEAQQQAAWAQLIGGASTYAGGRTYGGRTYTREGVESPSLNGVTAPVMVPASGSSMPGTLAVPGNPLPDLSELEFAVQQLLMQEEGRRLFSQALISVAGRSQSNSQPKSKTSTPSPVATHSRRGKEEQRELESLTPTTETVNPGGRLSTIDLVRVLVTHLTAGQNCDAPDQRVVSITPVLEAAVQSKLAPAPQKSRSARRHAARRKKAQLAKIAGGPIPLVPGPIPAPSKRAQKKAAKAAKALAANPQALPAPQTAVAKLTKSARRRQNQRQRTGRPKQAPPPPNPQGNRRARRAAKAQAALLMQPAPPQKRFVPSLKVQHGAGVGLVPVPQAIFGQQIQAKQPLPPVPRNQRRFAQLAPECRRSPEQRDSVPPQVAMEPLYTEMAELQSGMASPSPRPTDPGDPWAGYPPDMHQVHPAFEMPEFFPPLQADFRARSIYMLDNMLMGSYEARDDLVRNLLQFQDYLPPMHFWQPPTMPMQWTESGPTASAPQVNLGWGRSQSLGSEGVNEHNLQAGPAKKH